MGIIFIVNFGYLEQNKLHQLSNCEFYIAFRIIAIFNFTSKEISGAIVNTHNLTGI
jgi:hypothetical protein